MQAVREFRTFREQYRLKTLEVVVALATPEIHGSNPVIGNFLLSTVLRRHNKARNDKIKTNTII